MRRVVKVELWKAMHNKGMYMALLAGILLSLCDVIQNMSLVQTYIYSNRDTTVLSNGVEWCSANVTGCSVYYNWIGIGGFNFGNRVFYLVFPLLAAMAYGWISMEEKRKGYGRQMLTRIGKRGYILSKYIASFVAGGVAVAVPVVINFLLCALVMPSVKPLITDMVSGMNEPQMGAYLYYQHPLLFVIADIGLIFLWGGALGGLTLAAEQFITKRIVAVLLPFCCCILIEAFYPDLLATYFEWSPIQLFHMSTLRQTSAYIVFGEILFILAVSFLTVKVKGERNEDL